MKRSFRLFFPLSVAGFAAGLTACNSDAPQATIIEVNKKMPLLEWPDSAYVANLKEILAAEPVKKKEKEKTNIGMNINKAPTFTLPGSVTGKKDSKNLDKGNNGEKVAGKAPRNSSGNSQGQSAEVFMSKFSDALSKLQSDPSNSSLYKVVTANEGEDLFKLLKRTYGAGTQNLPRFYVLSALQSVNAGVALEHLNAGDKVRVPKI